MKLRYKVTILFSMGAIAHAAFADRATAITRMTAGNQEYIRGNYAGAETQFSSAIAEDGTWAHPYNNRALARLHLGRLAEADSDLVACKSRDATIVSVYVNRGKCLAAQRKFSEAVDELRAGLVIAPNNKLLHYNLGWVYDEQGVYAEAIAQYQAALTIDARYQPALAARGVARAKLADSPTTIAAAIGDLYDTIKNVSPGDVTAVAASYNLQLLRGPGISFTSAQAADRFRSAVFQFSTEQYDAAIASFMDARLLEPSVADIPLLRSWAHLKKQEGELAGAALEQVHSLLKPINIHGIYPGTEVFLNGVFQGVLPRVLHVFPSAYDLRLRYDTGSQKREWTGPIYGDVVAGGVGPMVAGVVDVGAYTAFGPALDVNRDWLCDNWETPRISTMISSADNDGDGLDNLREHWLGIDPEKVDTDSDGVSDREEITTYGSDPRRSNVFYYVNDGSLAGDQWSTAVGNDTNDGRSRATPKASLQAILAAYQLSPGAVVCIDVGSYRLAGDVEVTAADSGNRAQPLIIQGAGATTIIDRGDTGSGTACIRLVAAPGVVIRNMRMQGAQIGLAVQASNYCRIENCDLVGNKQAGLSTAGPNYELEIRNVLAASSVDGMVLSGESANDPVEVINCTMADNSNAGLRTTGLNAVSVRNTIIMASGVGALCLRHDSATAYGISDHNCYWATLDATLGRIDSTGYRSLGEWRNVMGEEKHSFSKNPLFVGAIDYHLQSQAGSYHDGSWTPDASSSACIDAGSPYTPWDREPNNNGSRIDMGRYGGTAQASRSAPARGLLVLGPRDGLKPVPKDVVVRWLASGQDWKPTDTLRLEYSTDGTSWTVAATGIRHADGAYIWDTTQAGANAKSALQIRLTGEQSTGPTDVSDVFSPSAANVNPGRLINLSILSSIASAGETFTMGYVVGGSGTSGVKPLVIRAAGPSLGALGVSGTCRDPKIEFYAGSAKTGENDDWGGSSTLVNAMAAVGAFAFSGPYSLDAAAILSVARGDNSVKVSGLGTATGTVLAEIYDATPSASFVSTTPRLINVSVLKQLGQGFTVGFVIGGSDTKNVLIRAIGPTLGSAFGLSGVVSDPRLTLYAGQTAMASNDDWGGGAALSTAFSAVGAFMLPSTSRDAALVAKLGPGNYTVQVSGSGGTGAILAEIYELP